MTLHAFSFPTAITFGPGARREVPGYLRRVGVLTSRAAGFLSLNGRKLQDARWVEQMGFWGPDADIGAYHGVYEFSPGTFR